MTGALVSDGFADTLRLDLIDLPGPRLVTPPVSTAAARPAPVATAVVTRAAPAAPTIPTSPTSSTAFAASTAPAASITSAASAARAETLNRRVTDANPDATPRASLFRRRETDPARVAFSSRIAARPIAASVAVVVEPVPKPTTTTTTTTTTIASLPRAVMPVAAAPMAAMPRAAMPRAAVPVATAPMAAVPIATAPVAEPQPALRLFVRGFKPMEQRLLEGAVRLSERRLPRLILLSEAEAAEADVLMLDGADEAAVAWLGSRPALAGKPTIWVDSRTARPGHTMTSRPVQWPMLPMLLARALENVQGPAWVDSMPVTPADMAGLNPAAPKPVARVDLNHVLVVDDSLAVRNHLRSLLEARGIRVSEAACVREALTAVETERFTCALMDVLMPDMDGYEGCKRLKSMKSSIGKLPVVMLTSKSSPFDRIRGKMAGCDAYLTKPVAPEQFYATLEAYISSGVRRPQATAQPSLAMRSA